MKSRRCVFNENRTNFFKFYRQSKIIRKRNHKISGRYVIDAKSIMGIFSLDLSKPIDLNIHAENQDADNIIELLKPYLV